MWPRAERLVWKETGLPRLYLRGGRPPQADVVEGILRETQQPNGISEVDDSIISVFVFAEALCLNYGSKLEICSGKSNTNEHKVSFTLYCHTPHPLKGEILITDATSTPTSHPIHSERLSTSREASYRGAQIQPILVSGLTYIETVAASHTLYLEC